MSQCPGCVPHFVMCAPSSMYNPPSSFWACPRIQSIIRRSPNFLQHLPKKPPFPPKNLPHPTPVKPQKLPQNPQNLLTFHSAYATMAVTIRKLVPNRCTNTTKRVSQKASRHSLIAQAKKAITPSLLPNWLYRPFKPQFYYEIFSNRVGNRWNA